MNVDQDRWRSSEPDLLVGDGSRVTQADPMAPVALPAPTLLVVAALAAAAFGQGAYYASGQRLVLVALAAAAVLAIVTARSVVWALRPSVGVCAALAAWSVASAALAGDPGAALPTVLLLAGAVVVVTTCERLDGQQREQLAAACVALGVLVALTGWVGVAWRKTPWALVDQGLWRAATTLTYANAAGGLLAVVALLSLGRSAASPRSVQWAGASCLLLTGLGASLSRGGLLAFLAGLLVLARLCGGARVLRAAVPSALGALVALAGVWPSISASSPPRPGLAACGLVVGLLVAAGAARLGPRRLVAVAVAVPLLLAVIAGGPAREPSRRVLDSRFSAASSSDRAEEARAALRVAAGRPLNGSGPGKADLSWVRDDGAVLFARYAHNEYLQVLAELGAVGLGLLLGLFVAIGREVRRDRAELSALPTWAGAVAGLVALAVDGLFDFGWHVPAIALTGALLVGIVTTNTREDQS